LETIVKIAEKQGAYQAEAFSTKSKATVSSVEDMQVKIGETKSSRGVGLRIALKHGKSISIGFTYTNSLSKSSLEQTVAQAIKIAKIRKPDPNFESFQEKKPTPTISAICDKQVKNLPSSEIIDLAETVLNAAKRDRRITAVRAVTGAATSYTAIYNSLGVSGEFEKTFFFGECSPTAKDGGSVGVGVDDFISCRYNPDGVINAAENAKNLAINQLNPKPIKPQKISLVAAPSVYGLNELFLHTLITELTADHIQKKQSPFLGKLNQLIAFEELTIIDDGTIPGFIASKPFDDEGCPTKTTKIIEKGVLKNYLHNSYTSKKDKVENTGNALRSRPFSPQPKYMLEPFVGPTNFIIKSGNMPPDDIIAEVKSGILVYGLLGSHTANVQSGEFSVATFIAFKIENGEIKHPVKEAMIGGNILDLLKSVDAVGNDPKMTSYPYYTDDASFIAPTIRIRNLRVTG
jgi:PmbA protein